MIKQECDNCRFFKQTINGNENEPSLGVCRFNPPAFRYWTEDGVLCSQEYLPRVDGTDWCGKYEVNPEMEAEWLFGEKEVEF